MPRAASRPPYAPADALVRFVRHIPDSRVPAAVTPDYVAAQDLGAGAGNERHVVSALRFLGLIDDWGHPTPDFRELTVLARQREVLARLLRQAYCPIFDAGAVDELTRDEAERRFMIGYGIAGQIREKAIRCFAALCELSDVRLPPEFLQRRHQVQSERRPRASSGRRDSARRPAPPATPSVAWPLAITLPVGLSEDEMVVYLRKVVRALQRLQVEGLAEDEPQ